MIVTTECYLPDYEVERLDIVYGVSVRSRSALGNMLGNIRAFFGGEQKGYVKMVIESREQAMRMMIEKAQALGADAIIGVRFDSTEFDAGQGQSMNEVIAYGTAVKLSPKSS